MEACDATQAVLRGGELVSAFLQGSHVEEDTPAECRRKGKGVVLASLLRPEGATPEPVPQPQAFPGRPGCKVSGGGALSPLAAVAQGAGLGSRV